MEHKSPAPADALPTCRAVVWPLIFGDGPVDLGPSPKLPYPPTNRSSAVTGPRGGRALMRGGRAGGRLPDAGAARVRKSNSRRG
jgi:hypothetical protein